MILSDRDIRQRMSTDRYSLDDHPEAAWRIRIDPTPEDRAFQPASIDLKLGDTIRVEWGDEDIWKPMTWVKVPLSDYANIGYPLMPGQAVLGDTEEKIFVPHDLAARVEGKSSIGRLFVSVHETAGFIDPGFEGTVTLEIKNNSPVVQYLRAGMYICQINFTQMTSPALRPYGSEGLGSHYQGQAGPTPAAG